ncbi:hypothetical protein FB566_3387 [Stackebrandtia endophytica]|uniref:Uncharacterized protein n=1 Tax=Stackebrandtia endophytica TaxID=1496996 RepID=A0A543AZ82_9ACTN|nr:hypothetical protein [Stackebrandtia endophytica]TQL77820.1 hypothetical protein FB566_3387 [Stackebrandtia endophytica]
MTGPVYERVTTDPRLEAKLIERLNAGTAPAEVVECAFTLGLRPAAWRDGDPMPGLDVTWPHDSEDQILVWHSY